jgi:hypothetical protein
MNEGGFVQTGNREPISPTPDMLVNACCSEFSILHSIKKVNKKLMSIFLSSWTKFVPIPIADGPKRWDRLNNL